MLYLDRADAGRQLGDKLRSYKLDEAVVVGLLRGGVAVAFEVANALNAPLDVMIARKIGAPGQPEFALGAVADGGKRVLTLNRSFIRFANISPAYLREEVGSKLKEIKEIRRLLNRPCPGIPLNRRTVIVVDDGMATGATMQSVVKRIQKENPARIVVAVPVASRSALDLLRGEADDVIALDTPDPFYAVGQFYFNFNPVTTEDAATLLKTSGTRRTKQNRPGGSSSLKKAV